MINPPAPWKPVCLLAAWLLLFVPMILAESPKKMDDVIRQVHYRVHPESAVSLEEITTRLTGAQESTLRTLLERWLRLQRYYQKIEFRSIKWAKNEDGSFSGEVEIFVPELIEKVVFQGNKNLEEARLLKFRKSWENVIPERRKPFEDGIVWLYIQEGYYGMSLDTEVVQGKIANHKTIIYHIHEGPRFDIRHYSFHGNRMIPPEDIKKVLSELDRKHAGGNAQRARLKALESFYEGKGFPDRSMEERSVLIKGSDHLVDIQLVISEGKQVIAHSVRFEMEGITLPSEELLKIIKTSVEKPVIYSVLTSDSTRISEFIKKRHGEEVSVSAEILSSEHAPGVQFRIRKNRPVTIGKFHFPSDRHLPNLAADIRDIASVSGNLLNTIPSLSHLYQNPMADKIHESYTYFLSETVVPDIMDAHVFSEGRGGALNYGMGWSSLFSHTFFLHALQKRFSFDWSYLNLGEIYAEYQLEITSDSHSGLWKWYENGFMGRPLYLEGTMDDPKRQKQGNVEPEP
ncbi:MAG TPA: hypothetical protein VNQ90_08780 [Chthoniobacteraceae bacterium]|nr:hypothetical protein [Chthoniobacteraceae bacterium]